MHGINLIKIRFHILIFSTAILVRLVFLLWGWLGQGLADESTLARVYAEQGYSLAAGYGYVRSSPGAGQEAITKLRREVVVNGFIAHPAYAEPLPTENITPEFLHPPGYPILFAALHRVLAIPAELPIRVVGLLLDSLAALLLFAIVRKFFHVEVAVYAGLLYAVFLPLAYYSTVSGLPIGLLSFFMLLAFYTLLRAMEGRGQMKGLWFAVMAIVIAMSVYFRPDFLLFPAFMAVFLLLFRKVAWRNSLYLVAVQILVFILLLPWAHRNYQLSGKWIFTSSSVGATLITGLGEFDNPWGFGYTDEHRTADALAQGITSPWSPEADVYFRALFVESVLKHPIGFVKSVMFRLPLALIPPLDWGYENPCKTRSFTEFKEEGEDRYAVVTKRFTYVLSAYWDRLLFAAINSVAIIAILIFLYREKERRWLILFLLAPHVYNIITHLVTHIEPRFMLPTIYGYLLVLAYWATGLLKKGNP
jgi:4-amino-4-deoxy-L-arabinose transferase-like glycosyltransferase